ncbi:MAG: sugar isomerase domain-containing protein [Bacillota bacterium]
MYKTSYLQTLQEILRELKAEEEATITEAAETCADAIENGGLVHLFGSGHSVIPVLDAFPRYGSYVGLHPLMDPRLMWFTAVGPGGAHELIWLERQQGYIDNFLRWHQLNEGDVMIVFSHGGKNAAPVETAIYAREQGLTVIGVTCMEHQRQAEASHSSGKLLSDVAHIAVDTHAPVEDAAVELENYEQKVAATSTVAAVAVTQLLVGEIARRLEEKGVDLDIFKSPTAGGSPEGNAEVFAHYDEKLRHH